jgi:hypothetical protein
MLTRIVSIGLAGLLLAAPAAVARTEAPRGEDIQAPRNPDIQAPRGQDVQAPRAAVADAPRV